MREIILAMRAFWDCWQNGTKLNFRDEFFKLTLMSPFFNPGPHDYPDIPIYISAINKNMLQLAGELCQGVHIHPLHTARYIEEFALPQLETGLQKSGRQRAEIELSSTVFVGLATTSPLFPAKVRPAGGRPLPALKPRNISRPIAGFYHILTQRNI
jgi:hypothetical protein